jgi:formylmethanofuran dehydrogenase subunit E
MKQLEELLQASAALHDHLCPRQVLGVRMGILAGRVLGIDLPQIEKRMLTIVETDGCAADGIAVATNCWVGRRTLRVEDYGKVAATFVDIWTERAVRIVPCREARQVARDYAPDAATTWQAYLAGYQRMPDAVLLAVEPVQLRIPAKQIISRADARAVCDECGEEIINRREVTRGDAVLCRACAGSSYYDVMGDVPLDCGRYEHLRRVPLPARSTNASRNLGPAVSGPAR